MPTSIQFKLYLLASPLEASQVCPLVSPRCTNKYKQQILTKLENGDLVSLPWSKIGIWLSHKMVVYFSHIYIVRNSHHRWQICFFMKGLCLSGPIGTFSTKFDIQNSQCLKTLVTFLFFIKMIFLIWYCLLSSCTCLLCATISSIIQFYHKGNIYLFKRAAPLLVTRDLLQKA